MTTLKEKILAEFDEKFPCVNTGCDNNGTIAVRVSDEDWEPEQCQYCYEMRLPKKEIILSTLDRVREETDDEIDTAWGIIANASSGDWSKETEEWRGAASRWRDRNMGGVSERKTEEDRGQITKEFPEGKERYCPQCYFEDSITILRKECKHNTLPPRLT